MNFFKRATTSILRRPGKTIILLILVFILGSVIAGALSVEGAIRNTDANLRRQMVPLASIDHVPWNELENHPNMILWEEYTAGWGEDEWRDFDPETSEVESPWHTTVTPEIVRAIGALPQVYFYDYSIRLWDARTDDLERYDGDGRFGWGDEGGPARFENVMGTASENLVQVDTGMIEMVTDSQFSAGQLAPGLNSSVAIISEALANQNGIAVGDTFTLSLFVWFPMGEWGDITWCHGSECWEDENIFERTDFEFEVIGLFDVPVDPEDTDDWRRVEALNTIYVPNWALEEMSRRHELATIDVWNHPDVDMPEWMDGQMPDRDAAEERDMHVTPLFVLNDPDDMEAFAEAAAEYLPSWALHIHFRSGGFDNISSSMATMRTIASWILIASFVATLLILSLLITLFLRDRRYEMGVYLALGEKKGKIISQILLEVVATSFVAITLAVGVGSLMSSAVSRGMLMNQLTADTSSDMMIHHWDVFDQIGLPSMEMTPEEMMDQFDVSLSMGTIGLFYAVGLGAVIISSLVPVIYVITLNPKKVLM